MTISGLYCIVGKLGERKVNGPIGNNLDGLVWIAHFQSYVCVYIMIVYIRMQIKSLVASWDDFQKCNPGEIDVVNLYLLYINMTSLLPLL